MNASPAEMLSHLEDGFRASSARLQAAENELRMAIQRGREFGEKHAAEAALNPQWNDVEAILSRILELAQKIDQASRGTPAPRDIESALEAWNTLQTEGPKLEEALTELRDQAAKLDPGLRQEWNALADEFGKQVEALLACGSTLRVRLELREGRSQEEVDQFIENVLTELRGRPMPQAVEASTYQLEYLKAAVEIAHEKQEFLGFPRVIKTLFTWYENPEERVRRKLLLPID